MKKSLVIFLMLFCHFSIAEENQDKFHCVIKDLGDVPKIKFRGPDRDSTFYKTVKLCLSLRISNYHAARLHEPSVERKILFMENCVNNTFCIENYIDKDNK
jgi:hypothetical protein